MRLKCDNDLKLNKILHRGESEHISWYMAKIFKPHKNVFNNLTDSYTVVYSLQETPVAVQLYG